MAESIDAYEREILVSYCEIYLKSDPVRKRYEQLLENNTRKALEKEGIPFKFGRKRLRLVVKTKEHEKASLALKRVPGIASFSVCSFLPTSELGRIKEFCREKYPEWIGDSETFAVRVKRNGTHDYSSKDAEREIGSAIKRKVDLSNPKKTIHIEIDGNETHVYTSKEKGIGGLPVGASGRMLSLLSGGIDSPVSSFLMMKRGCKVDFIHFHSFPIVSNKSVDKAQRLAQILSFFQGKSRLAIVPFAEIQMAIKTGANEKHRVMLYRRSMVKIAEKIAEKDCIISLCTGESLGQVASQTLENLVATNSAVKMPIMRPLIGMDKEEIIMIAKKIGTYETSIEPHEDCCTLFVPKHPATKTIAKELLATEKKIGLTRLENKAIKETKTVWIE